MQIYAALLMQEESHAVEDDCFQAYHLRSEEKASGRCTEVQEDDRDVVPEPGDVASFSRCIDIPCLRGASAVDDVIREPKKARAGQGDSLKHPLETVMTI
jgi:hypothetical protein